MFEWISMIDDFTPQSMHRPANVAELSELIRRASAEGLALYPFGGGTMQHLGYTPTKPGLGIDMRAFDQVIDYPARDMTITVQAGITISKLQEVLGKENQRLPIDVPQPEFATLGGAIAVNASGPRRYGFGTLRDYVIGISFMNDAGQEVKAGGRVVKNVAGYDICKLQIGALGTLGIITQVTLKVKPKPEAAALMMAPCKVRELASRIDELFRTQTRPVAIEVTTARAAGQDSHFDANDLTIWVLFEESAEAVRWQAEQLKQESAGVFAGVNGLAVVNALITGSQLPSGLLTFRANVMPSALPGFVQTAVTLIPLAHVIAHAGNGIVTGFYVADELSLEHANKVVGSLRQFAVGHHGNLIITRCPAEWKRELPIWGEPRGDWALMKKVKQAIDPKNLFNPGRFIVG
jgi:glycolate oxidase FAD binding subunit